MNIFYFSHDVYSCARHHCDKHVVKMILETAQLLCTTHHVSDTSLETIPYKKTHENHPSAVWVRSSINHYRWTVMLLYALCKEYTYRYGKTHKTEQYYRLLKDNEPNLPNLPFTKPPQCMPDKYKQIVPEHGYRAYFNGEKQRMAKWTKRNEPFWYETGIIEKQKEWIDV